MKTKSIIIKALKYIIIIFVLAIIAMIIFSPYGKQKGFDYKLVKTTVKVNNWKHMESLIF